jgi:serine/threonine-protein kinase HipA
MKTGEIRYNDLIAGYVKQTEEGYAFRYTTEYLNNPGARPISLTMQLTPDEFNSKVLFPFFDGLIPEGWLLAIAEQNWKIAAGDRMELLLTCCKDCIGAVSVIRVATTAEE